MITEAKYNELLDILASAYDAMVEPSEYDVDDARIIERTEDALRAAGRPVFNKWVAIEDDGIVWRDNETRRPVVYDTKDEAEVDCREDMDERDEQIAKGERDADDTTIYEAARCLVNADGSLLLRDGRIIPANDML